jgi:hypothetical protein
MSTDTSTNERARATASTAADEGRHVAGVAADEAKGVATEAVQHARGVVDDAMSEARIQLDEQGRQQKDRLAGTLATFGDDLSRMAQDESGLAADVAHEVADRARSLSRHLDQREPGELLDDVRRFARQRPGVFLLGAVAAGVVVGRLVRGTKDAVEAAAAEDDAASRSTWSTMPGVPTPPPPPPVAPSMPPMPPSTSPSATGYPSPPLGTGLSDDGPLSSPGGTV